MLHMLVNQFLEEFEMQNFTTQPRPGQYAFTFSGNREISLYDFNSCYVLKGIIGPMPRENIDAALSKIMDANLYGKGTDGGVIGSELNQLVLSKELSTEISYAQFCEALENFLNSLDRLTVEYK